MLFYLRVFIFCILYVSVVSFSSPVAEERLAEAEISSLKSTTMALAVKDTSTSYFYLDTTKLGSFVFPFSGKVISHFGKRGRRMHTGTDIKLNRGDTVRAGFTGIVTKSSRYYGYGNLVVLKHPGGIETYYAHLSKCLVEDGDSVTAGQPVGLGGRTGRATTNHLHFELRADGRPMNSEKLFDFANRRIISLLIETSRNTDSGREEKSISEKKEDTLESSAETDSEYHIIRQGDTLYSLARKNGTTVEALCKLNHISKNAKLHIGQKLKIK